MKLEPLYRVTFTTPESLAGDHLYVVDAAIASVSVFTVSGGSLSELGSSPTALPTGATPFGIAIVTA